MRTLQYYHAARDHVRRGRLSRVTLGLALLAVAPLVVAANPELPAPAQVRLGHSGEGDRVLVNSLLELTLSLPDTAQHTRTVTVTFTPPAGSPQRVAAKNVYRSAPGQHWVARFAPQTIGAWSYTATIHDGTTPSAATTQQGAFDVFAPSPSRTDEKRPPAPFRVLYNNDLFNVLHGHPRQVVADLIAGSVRETAPGVDAHFQAPSFTWVPMWQSRLYPMAEHIDWFRHTFGAEHTEIMTDYVAGGGDAVAVFVQAARANGQAAILSMRMNDHHYLDVLGADIARVEWRGPRAMRHRSRFYHENPEYRLGSDTASSSRVLDWTRPEVRGHLLSLIHEVVAGYAIDGIELDFLRHSAFFPDHTSAAERQSIMTEFVTQVRRLIDAHTPSGEYRWLAVRIPAYRSAHEALGINPPALQHAGVDIATLAMSYQLNQQSDDAEIRRAMPSVAVYLELNHVASFNRTRDDLGWRQPRRQFATDPILLTTAHLAYARGLSGVSFFNMAYYRNASGTGPSFHVLPRLGDPASLAAQPQHYVLDHYQPTAGSNWRSLQRLARLSRGKSFSSLLRLSPPADGWQVGGRLRAHLHPLTAAHRVEVTLNGHELTRTDDVSPLYASPFPEGIAPPEEFSAWTVPAGILIDGENRLEIHLKSGPPIGVRFIEAGLR